MTNPASAERSQMPRAGRVIHFTKMHGIGNDYIYVNGFEQTIENPAELSRRIADRHFGVGADGLILVLPPPPEKGVDAHVRMRMFNADGSESEMCGNGIRCVCKFAHDRGLAPRDANPMRVQTGRGVLSLAYTLDQSGLVDQVTVDMGAPILALRDIPVNESELGFVGVNHHYGFETDDRAWIAVFVSMGNPHAVVFADENAEEFAGGLAEMDRVRILSSCSDSAGHARGGLAKMDLARIGPAMEHHRAFPHRMNIHFVEVHSPREVTMRTWERGSGITLACGTGAAAVCVAGALTGRTDREILAHLPGGDLQLRWDEATGHVFKTGPATEVFSGEWRD